MTSRKTIARMSLYRRLLISLREAGTTHVYSHQLGASRRGHCRPGAARFHGHRLLGQPHARLRGRAVHREHRRLPRRARSGRRSRWSASASSAVRVLAHFAGRRPKLAIVACFDNDAAKVGTSIEGCRCHHVDELDDVICRARHRDRHPRRAAGQPPRRSPTASSSGGVRSIVSFASTPLHVPADVTVEDMDITAALETAAYLARHVRASRDRDARRSRRRRGGGRRRRARPDAADASTTCSPAATSASTTWRDASAPASSRARRRRSAQIAKIYAGDRVSDLLDQASDTTLLVTNLMSLQLIRLAELMDVPAVCFVNGAVARARP